MSGVVLLTKCCNECGVTKPASDFYADRQRVDGLSWGCKECSRASARASAARRREEMGEEAWKAHQRAIVRAYRGRAGGAQKARQYSRARHAALERLKELHSGEFDYLLEVAKREEGM